jgi:hypothetical protein
MSLVELNKQRQDYKDALYDLFSGLQSETGGGTGGVSADRFHLIGGVKIKIDEMMPEGEGVAFEVQDLVYTADNLDIIINSFLDPAAKLIHQVVSPTLINGVIATATPTPLTSPDNGSGYVVIPSDFIRLQSFKMVSWDIDVNEPITSADPKYKMQKNIHLRGGAIKPVCVINRKKVGSAVKKILEYYSVEAGDHALDQFIYIPEVAAENVQDDLVDALTWVTAAKVLEVTGNTEASKRAFEMFDISLKNLM